MNNIEVFVVGNIGTEPNLSHTDGKKPVLWFRVACTPRVWDRESGQMRDGRTEWLPVKAWGSNALNGHTSLRKGTRVVVRGILREEIKQGNDGERVEKVLYADSLGLDLQFGSAEFRKTARTHSGQRPDPEQRPDPDQRPDTEQQPVVARDAAEEVPAAGDGEPADEESRWPEPALPREYTTV